MGHFRFPRNISLHSGFSGDTLDISYFLTNSKYY